MSLNLTGVHKYERISGTQEVRLTGTNPYLRLAQKDHPPLFLQGGQVYSEGEGKPALTDKEIPEWFWDRLEAVNPVVLEEVGFGTARTDAVGAAPITVWKCDECGDEVPVSEKSKHIINHRRNPTPPSEKSEDGDGKAKKG